MNSAANPRVPNSPEYMLEYIENISVGAAGAINVLYIQTRYIRLVVSCKSALGFSPLILIEYYIAWWNIRNALLLGGEGSPSVPSRQVAIKRLVEDDIRGRCTRHD